MEKQKKPQNLRSTWETLKRSFTLEDDHLANCEMKINKTQMEQIRVRKTVKSGGKLTQGGNVT